MNKTHYKHYKSCYRGIIFSAQKKSHRKYQRYFLSIIKYVNNLEKKASNLLKKHHCKYLTLYKWIPLIYIYTSGPHSLEMEAYTWFIYKALLFRKKEVKEAIR